MFQIATVTLNYLKLPMFFFEILPNTDSDDVYNLGILYLLRSFLFYCILFIVFSW